MVGASVHIIVDHLEDMVDIALWKAQSSGTIEVNVEKELIP
ncbi:hypothetical protein VTH82DRAFT_3948 [Thermothelomyces myriococcoides]